MENKDLILKLHDINAIKFGEFKLKSGIMSPIYIDLRPIISYPQLLKDIAGIMWEEIKDLQFDNICGVPYAALPIAAAMSLEHDRPMLMRRKEVKDYGTKKAIEGVFEKGQTSLIVEDLVTSGASVFETIEPLEHEGLVVKDIVILLDREQGGKDNIEAKGYTLHSVVSITQALDVLLAEQKIDQTTYDKTVEFIKSTQVKS